MKSSGRCKRRFSAVVGVGLATLLLLACHRSEFEREHDRAIAENPDGVQLEIRTRENKNVYALSEPVQIEEFYTAKYAGRWHIEVLDGWNDASLSDFVHLMEGGTISEQPPEPAVGGICCDSRHVWLSLDPVRIPYKLFGKSVTVNPESHVNPEWHAIYLPSKKGNYQLYITTHRVFGQGDAMKTYHGQGAAVSSNVLKLEVK